ncbi:MAG: bifunctional diaminohydroxyphosphoribosylaminopyrimidine deaminase/5-amino-6-(5-phosphoribosylamino)uracil reductase RibD [Pseudomonadota bacterium]
MNFSADDHRHMAEALRLARRGLWTTDPNPSVGCVLAHGCEVIGRGYTQRPGEPHAEIMALRDAGPRARGATVYSTLEPCSHYGRTPPCADALIEAGVAKVISAMRDPNPLVDGSGNDRLKKADIEVQSGLMEPHARDLNPGFISRFERGRPWLRAKIAGSLDGRTTGPDGESKWITSEHARADGHRFRARASAILTGIETVLADDPTLDVRLAEFQKTPPIIVLDSQARLPQDAKILHSSASVLQVTGHATANPVCEQLLLEAGADGHIPLKQLMPMLAEREINELHVEAGATLTGSLLMQNLVDELIVYQADCLIGDQGRGLLALPGMEKLDQRLHLRLLERRQIGPDWRLRYAMA